MVRPRPLVKGVASHLSGSQTAKKRRAGGKTNWQADGGDTLGVPVTGPQEIDTLKQRYTAERKRLKSVGQPMAGACRIFTAAEWEVYICTTRGKSVKAKSARELRAEAFEKRLGLGKKEDRSILKKNVKLTIGKVGEEEMSVSLESENDEEVESEDGYASVLQVQGVDQKIDELASSDSGDGGPVLMTGRDLVKFGIEHETHLSDLSNDELEYEDDLTEDEEGDEDAPDSSEIPVPSTPQENRPYPTGSNAATQTFFQFESMLAQAYKDMDKAHQDEDEEDDELPIVKKRAKRNAAGKKARKGGISGAGERLGGPSNASHKRTLNDTLPPSTAKAKTPRPNSVPKGLVHSPWSCPVCTLENVSGADVCGVCETRRNDNG